MFSIDSEKTLIELKKAGFNPDQSKIMIKHFVTKTDEYENPLNLISKLQSFDKKIDQLKIWMLSAMLTQTIALVALILSVSN